MAKKKSQISKVYNALRVKDRVSVNEMRSRLKVGNPYEVVRKLREEGFDVRSEKGKSRGKVVTMYSLNSWYDTESVRERYRLYGARAFR